MADVLFLQGPYGPFFKRLAREMEADGVRIHKINFNAGDALFFQHPKAISFRGKIAQWPDFLKRFLLEKNIHQIYLFGDYRIYHKIARQLARSLGIRVFVLEEGYLRPDYITLEEGGMHANSPLPRSADFYRQRRSPEPATPEPVGKWMRLAVLYGALYYIVSNLFFFMYPNYQHHRGFNTLKQGATLFIKGLLYLFNRLRDRRKEHIFSTWLSKRYFLVALQVRDDSTVIENSEYATVSCFIREVVESFAQHASANDFLVIKHHPFDTSFWGYASLIRQLKRQYGLGERVIYIHHVSVPMLLKNSKGTVVINSTVGMSSLHHAAPVKVMGQAVYDFSELSSEVDLDQFWATASAVDTELYRAFRRYLCQTSQVNGNFYKPLFSREITGETGCLWRTKPWLDEIGVKALEANPYPSDSILRQA